MELVSGVPVGTRRPQARQHSDCQDVQAQWSSLKQFKTHVSHRQISCVETWLECDTQFDVSGPFRPILCLALLNMDGYTRSHDEFPSPCESPTTPSAPDPEIFQGPLNLVHACRWQVCRCPAVINCRPVECWNGRLRGATRSQWQCWNSGGMGWKRTAMEGGKQWPVGFAGAKS